MKLSYHDTEAATTCWRANANGGWSRNIGTLEDSISSPQNGISRIARVELAPATGSLSNTWWTYVVPVDTATTWRESESGNPELLKESAIANATG
jgi:hypothetical protein